MYSAKRNGDKGLSFSICHWQIQNPHFVIIQSPVLLFRRIIKFNVTCAGRADCIESIHFSKIHRAHRGSTILGLKLLYHGVADRAFHTESNLVVKSHMLPHYSPGGAVAHFLPCIELIPSISFPCGDDLLFLLFQPSG